MLVRTRHQPLNTQMGRILDTSFVPFTDTDGLVWKMPNCRKLTPRKPTVYELCTRMDRLPIRLVYGRLHGGWWGSKAQRRFVLERPATSGAT